MNVPNKVVRSWTDENLEPKLSQGVAHSSDTDSDFSVFSTPTGFHISAQGRAKSQQTRSAALGFVDLFLLSPVKGETILYNDVDSESVDEMNAATGIRLTMLDGDVRKCRP